MTYDHDAKYLHQSIGVTKEEAENLGEISKQVILQSLTNKSHSKAIQTIQKTFDPLDAKQTAIVTYTIIEFIKKEIHTYIKKQDTNEQLKGYI